jgi:cell division initiation protein
MFDPALSDRGATADTYGQADQRTPKPTMNVSPLDLRQQRFRTALRGFDKIEVTSFLMAVADDYEQALRETDRLRQEVARLEGVVAQHREHERSLQTTLVTAQKLADDVRANAEIEGQRILNEAHVRSELLLEKTQARLEDVQREIDGLKLKRRDVETTIESTIQTLRNTLEYVREQDARDREEKILLHRPRLADQMAERVKPDLQDLRHEANGR